MKRLDSQMATSVVQRELFSFVAIRQSEEDYPEINEHNSFGNRNRTNKPLNVTNKV